MRERLLARGLRGGAKESDVLFPPPSDKVFIAMLLAISIVANAALLRLAADLREDNREMRLFIDGIADGFRPTARMWKPESGQRREGP